MTVFSDLQGRTITEIVGLEPDSTEVTFRCADGAVYRMRHEQDCCEDVDVQEIVGDAADLIGSPITRAEESTSENDAMGVDSYTWTFYRLDTAKGDVVIRWLGTSNGNYSEAVGFKKQNAHGGWE